MFAWLRRRRGTPAAIVPDGGRVYAIGDVHGRIDLLDRLLAMLAADQAGRAEAAATVILLGDLIDRGPASAAVVARAMAGLDWAELRTIKGNHEDAMASALGGDRRMMAHWLDFGGVATLRSYGVKESLLGDGSLDELLAAARAAIPAKTRAWIAALPTHIGIGGYHFVHAGVRPGVPLDAQADEDRIWIRREFLGSRADLGAVVVHGHSQVRDVEWRRNRIAIDTGAYHSDRLSALALEGTERRVLQT